MKCHSPIQIRTEKERNTVPCGRCAACLSNKRTEWSTRMEIELKEAKTAHFITLTYSDVNLPKNKENGIPELVKKDVQLFMKRLRKTQEEKIKYYFIGEYGEKTFRPHYHAILFNLTNIENIVKCWTIPKTNEPIGHVHVGTVTPASIKYCTGYMIQQKHNWSIQKPFALMSKGLGLIYVQKNKQWHKSDIYRNYIPKEDGKKTRMPRYLRDKIFTKSEKKRQAWRVKELENQEVFYKQEEKENLRLEIERKEKFKKQVNKRLKNNSKI